MKLFLEYSGGEILPFSSCTVKTRRVGNRMHSVLCSCEGEDFTAASLAGLTAQTAISMLAGGAGMEHTARELITAMGGRKTGFLFGELDGRGGVRCVEYRMPQAALLRGGKLCPAEGETIRVGGEPVILRAETLRDGDLFCCFSQGIVRRSKGEQMESGWGRKGAAEFMGKAYTGEESARSMCELLLSACRNLQPEGGGAAFLCRAKTPHALCVAVGEPSKRIAEDEWARNLLYFPGTRVICGSDAACLFARITGRELTTDLSPLAKPGQKYRLRGIDYIFSEEESLKQAMALLSAPLRGRAATEEGRELAALLDRRCTEVRFFVGGGGAMRHDLGVDMKIKIVEQIADLLRSNDKAAEIDYC